jgi:hypothetical protein
VLEEVPEEVWAASWPVPATSLTISTSSMDESSILFRGNGFLVLNSAIRSRRDVKRPGKFMLIPNAAAEMQMIHDVARLALFADQPAHFATTCLLFL